MTNGKTQSAAGTERRRDRRSGLNNSLNTRSETQYKLKTKTAHSADDTSHHTRTTMVGSPRSAHSTLISQHATSDRTDGTTVGLQAQIGRRSRTRTRGSGRTLSIPTPLACEVVP